MATRIPFYLKRSLYGKLFSTAEYALYDLHQMNYRAPLFYRHIYLEQILLYCTQCIMLGEKGVYTWNSRKNFF